MDLKNKFENNLYLRSSLIQMAVTVAGALILFVFIFAVAPTIAYYPWELVSRGLAIWFFSAVISFVVNRRYNSAFRAFSDYLRSGRPVPPEMWPIIDRVPYALPYRLLVLTIILWSFNTTALGLWLQILGTVHDVEALRIALSGMFFSPLAGLILFYTTRLSMHRMVASLQDQDRGRAQGSRLGLRAKLILGFICLSVLPLLAGVIIEQVQRERAVKNKNLAEVCDKLRSVHALGDGSISAWQESVSTIGRKPSLPPGTSFQVSDASGYLLAGAMSWEAKKVFSRVIKEGPAVGGCVVRPVPSSKDFLLLRYFEDPAVWVCSMTRPLPETVSIFSNYSLTIPLALTVIALGILMGYLAADDVSRSAHGLAQAANKAAKGQYEHVTGMLLDDEMHEMAAGFNVMVDFIRAELGRAEEYIANINQVVTGLSRHAAEIQGLASRQREVIDEQNPLAVQASGGAEEVSRAADEISERARHARSRMEEVTEKTRATYSTLSDLDQAIKSVDQSSSWVADEMRTVEHSFLRMEEVVAIIDDIAERTEMLAMNASLEAAGQNQDRTRFAVVAGEVRRLSERISEQTKNIKHLFVEIRQSSWEMSKAVENSREQAAAAPGWVQRMGEELKGIENRATHTAQSMKEITNMTEEQSRALEDMKLLVGEIRTMAEIMDQISSGTETTSKSLAELAGQLKKLTVR